MPTFPPSLQRALPLVLIALCLWPFLQSLGFGFVNWDDGLYFLYNPVVLGQAKALDHLLTPDFGYIVPLTQESYRLEYLLFRHAPLPAHAINLALFAVCLGLFYSFLRRIGVSKLFAFCGVALFASHPLCAEVTCWVSARKELLISLACLGVMHTVYTKKLHADAPRTSTRSYFFIALCFLLGMLSKPTIGFIPGWIFFLGLQRATAKERRRYWLFSGVLLITCMPLLYFGSIGQAKSSAFGNAQSFAAIAIAILRYAAHYAHTILFPTELLPKYLLSNGPDAILRDMCWGFALIGLGLTVLLVVRRSRRYGPPLWFAACAYVPVSGLVPLQRELADSFLFLPWLGLAWAGALLLEDLGKRLTSTSIKRAMVAGALVLVASLQVQSAMQAAVWRDGVTLWTAVARHYNDNTVICRNIGLGYFYRRNPSPKDFADAATTFDFCLKRFGDKHYYGVHLANALYLSGQRDKAIALAQRFCAEGPCEETLRMLAGRR